MSAPANTNRSSEKKREQYAPADTVQSLKAIYYAYEGLLRRVDEAVAAGEVCMFTARGQRGRAQNALMLAVRGMIPPAQASLEIQEAEYAAMSKAALPFPDFEMEEIVTSVDVILQPRRPPYISPDSPFVNEEPEDSHAA
nr:hypothetical protein [Methylobacterium sp. L1A1]